jgi:hypothetical protein
MRDIVLPRKEGRNDLSRSRRSEKDSVEARDRRMLEFPPSMSHREVAKLLQAEGCFSPKTTNYYIEYRVRPSNLALGPFGHEKWLFVTTHFSSARFRDRRAQLFSENLLSEIIKTRSFYGAETKISLVVDDTGHIAECDE